MPRHHTRAGWTQERGFYQENIEFTAAEESARDAEEAAAAIDRAAEETAAAAKVAARQRGVDKLIALGLTAEEVDAL